MAVITRIEYSFETGARTDVGRVRRLNEDAVLSRPEIGLWAVADGMGGHESGDYASRRIVQGLSSIGSPSDGRSFAADVRAQLKAAHDDIRAKADARGEGTIIGSTVVVLMVYGGRFVCFWAGDSRLYLLRDRQLWRVTRDHTHVQDLLEQGAITEKEAEGHPLSNVITRAVGAHGDLDLEMVRGEVADGDVFLLCSDGLIRVVSDEEIAQVIADHEPSAAVDKLIAVALERHAPDNVTVVLMRCDGEERQVEVDETEEPTLVPGNGAHAAAIQTEERR